MIWLQFMRIEEYFSSFIFAVRSAFNGRFRSFSCSNSWFSCFNGCIIESRKQEDHEELKIFLQNRLISSRFDQKLKYKGRTSEFIRKFRAKNADRPIRWRQIDGHDCAMIVGHDPMILRKSLVRSSSEKLDASMCHPTIAWRGPTLFAYFAHPILIGASSRSQVLKGESSIALT